MIKPKIGNIIEIPNAKGLAYAQYTHQHPQFGGLIRVFDTIFEKCPSDLSNLVNGSVRFSTFFPVASVINRGIFKVIGYHDIAPHNKAFPLFRDGIMDPKTKKVAVWWLWDGKKEWKVGNITSEQKKLPIREVLNDAMLIKFIEDGWTPSNDPT